MFPVRPKKKHRGPLGGPKLFFVMLNLFSTDLPKQRFLFITIGFTLATGIPRPNLFYDTQAMIDLNLFYRDKTEQNL